MKLKMSDRSLFAILLRSPWWVSFALVAAFVMASSALLPTPYIAYGVMGGFPFLVIGVMAAWRQWRAPNPTEMADVLARIGAMSWSDFSIAVENAYQRQGYAVSPLKNVSADFQLTRAGHMTLVSCKRWKAASQGIDVVRDLAALQKAMQADQSTLITLGQVSDTARRFAKEHAVQIVSEQQISVLFMHKNRP
ncbi:MAG TPA: restriction endonuclease [Burkholderiaceae bacterium]|jgi:restriction system protein|nr:restriction endonuclease [Burkholderiaceae bacterium]HPH12439.1 restriction endonuclease [Burkholderiaceae bacterium]